MQYLIFLTLALISVHETRSAEIKYFIKQADAKTEKKSLESLIE